MGAKLGALSVLLYLLEGAFGLPVFAKHIGGISHLLGPTGGYLLGFIPSVLFMGYFYDNKSILKTALIVLGGTCITFIFGLLQLSFFVPVEKLLAVGLYPFIAGGIIKSLVATLTIPRCCEFFKKIKED
jgi:biotin transport system substrate-specific component